MQGRLDEYRRSSAGVGGYPSVDGRRRGDRTEASGRHRTTSRLPGPLGLAILVAVLLVTFGTGAALLPPSFAGGRSGAGAGAEGRAAAQGVPGTLAGETADIPGTATLGKPPAAPPDRKTGTRPAEEPNRTTVGTTPARPRSGTVARENEVTTLVNRERGAAGCGRVRTDERLRRAARGHSQDMANRDYFSHDSLDGRSPWDRAEAQGYDRPIGENIAKGQRTPQEVVQAWMDSPGHRRNILNCDAKAIGVGLAFDGGTPIWTQLFGAV